LEFTFLDLVFRSNTSFRPTSVSPWYYKGTKTKIMHLSDLLSQSDCSKMFTYLRIYGTKIHNISSIFPTCWSHKGGRK